MNLITTGLTTVLNSSAGNRFNQTVTNLKVNGFLVDVSFTVPASYTNKWNFLKNVYLNVTERLGAENGGAVALISDVSLYSLLALSDYEAGVSMQSTSFTQGQIVRISGYLPAGFFAMGSRDALEFTLTVADYTGFPSSTNVNCTISAVYDHIEANNYIIYKESLPTGADQPYKNVLKLFYVGATANQNITVIDQCGTKTVNIGDSLALSNARGRFEFFTDFGEFYADEFGVSQDLSMRVPVISGARLLIKQYAFYPSVLDDNADDTSAEREALIAKIRVNDSEKYRYLQKLGIA